MISCVYRIFNNQNNRFYIGSTKNFQKRKARHIRELKQNIHHNQFLQRDFNKCGTESFDFIVIKEVDNELLLQEEDLVIKKHWGNELLYNLSDSASGGDTLSNHPNKEDIIRRRNKTHQDWLGTLSKEQKVELFSRFGSDNHMTGKHHSRELIEQQRVANKGRCPPNKGKTNMEMFGEERTKEIANLFRQNLPDYAGRNNPFYGKKHDAESRLKNSTAHLGKKTDSQCKPIQIDNVCFKSLGDANLLTGTPIPTIRWRVKSRNPKFSNYQYCSENIAV